MELVRLSCRRAMIGATLFALTTWGAGAESGFLVRVERTDLHDSHGKSLPRVWRNADGDVESLWLTGMQLTADDFATIARLKSLRSLVLYRTNTSDAKLLLLRELPRLESLNLTSTEISDDAVEILLKMDSLRAVCLGDVAVTPQTVARLKEQFRLRGRSLSLGYSQRR